MAQRLAGQLSRRTWLAAALVAALPVGCAGPGVETPVAQNARGPRVTGQFPNLNIPPEAAADQFTPEERAAKSAELASARERITAPVEADAANQNDLRKLAQTHAQAALREIEN